MFPLVITYVGKSVPRSLAVAAVSWIGTSGAFGATLVPYFTGAMADKFGIAVMQPMYVISLFQVGSSDSDHTAGPPPVLLRCCLLCFSSGAWRLSVSRRKLSHSHISFLLGICRLYEQMPLIQFPLYYRAKPPGNGLRVNCGEICQPTVMFLSLPCVR